jgi:valacyclovir hydrolase
MAWFEHGGSRIYYEEYGQGDPALLLPGFSQNAEQLATLRDALAARYRVIAADLPGSGRSEPQPRAYTASYYEDDARSFAALLDHLAARPAHLIGFSDGGEVVLLMAAQTPKIARSAVTWGAVGVISDPDGSLRATMYNIVDNPFPPLQSYRDFLVNYYGEANARAMTQSMADAMGAITEAGGEVALAKADSIACPVLLIAGEQDMFVPPALLSQSAARIRGAESVIVNGAGHDPLRSHPDWMAQTVLDWLQRH